MELNVTKILSEKYVVKSNSTGIWLDEYDSIEEAVDAVKDYVREMRAIQKQIALKKIMTAKEILASMDMKIRHVVTAVIDNEINCAEII